jgi:capsular polysaccharide biosynthesis protein
VQYFHDAKIVIAQHGAALANVIWMKPGSIVIEIADSRKLQHFKMISKILNHNYSYYSAKDLHATINIEKMHKWIKSNPLLSKLMQDN